MTQQDRKEKLISEEKLGLLHFRGNLLG